MLDALEAAVRLAERTGLVVVEERGHTGLPRLACARQLSPLQGPRVALAGWFSPDVATDLYYSGDVAIVVWDESLGSGYHLTGWTENRSGGAPVRPGGAQTGLASGGRCPELYVRVEKVIAFGVERPCTTPA